MKKILGLVSLAPAFVFGWTTNVLAQEVDCPPNLIDETVDKVTVVGDGCVIQGSSITNGNVQATEVNGFRLEDSAVTNGDVQISKSQDVRVNDNMVRNGKIQVEESTGTGPQSTRVNRNTVGNGNVQVNKNEDARVQDNTLSGDIECVDNDALVSSGNTARGDDDCP